MTLQYVPIIDLAPYFAGTPEGKLQLPAPWTRPVATWLSGHHQPSDSYRIGRAGVAADTAVLRLAAGRAQGRPAQPDMVRGYSAVAEESLSYSLEEAAPVT